MTVSLPPRGLRYADLEYINRVNGLIPQAERIADEVTGPKPLTAEERAVWSRKWDQAFHSTMDMLCFEHGLRVMSHQVVMPAMGGAA